MNHIRWYRIQLSKFWEILAIDFPSFPRLPRPAPRGRTNNGTRPIMMTMIRNQAMESGYFFPKVSNRYVQLLRQIAVWLGYLLLIVALFVIFPIFCFLVALISCPFMMIRGYKDELLRMCFNAAEVPSIFLGSYRHSFVKREREWDYEMGKPIPLPRDRKRRLSQIRSKIGFQSSSSFLAKLPVEIRLEIYKYAIVQDSNHVHLAVHWTRRPGERGTYSHIHGHPCNQPLTEIPVSDCNCNHSVSAGVQRPHNQFIIPENHGRGRLALPRTCTQVYRETIDLLYSE